MTTDARTGKLHGRNVVVIGGSRGLGRVIVTAAHAQGAHVLAVARGLDALGKLSRELPGSKTLAIDATDEEAPAKIFETLQPDLLWSAEAQHLPQRRYRK